MIADHTKVADMPKQLAIAKQVELSNGPSVAQKAKLKMIDVGDDAKFDARYAKTFGVEAHRGTIKLFQKAAASGCTTYGWVTLSSPHVFPNHDSS